ncbi:TPA: helix-turn-helix domain-containing protein, partial [Candidatus Micrarchaeota archaeon]|nr:helix-turn-helix domain-containing protein [Candidatus Micrarchaeota archaeon]
MDEGQIEKLKESMKADFIETHISWIFLKGDFVYKIKKPVKFSFLDFSTLEKRRELCGEEVRLNKRLSPDVYLGVVPVVEDNGIRIEGEGELLDYAVKMRRLPQERRMDILLAEGKVSEEHIERIAGIVAGFHKMIDVIPDKEYSSADVVKGQIDDLGSFRDTIEKACGMGAKVGFVLEKCGTFIGANRELFGKRQEEGRIKDCHGDLHSANIFITDDIIIFDCIEFSRDFRYVDVSSEIAFMAMDLDAFGKPDFSRLFVEKYVELSGDKEALELLDLYKCYRANVRAKIAAIDYSQHPGDEPKERIMKYMELAERYAIHERTVANWRTTGFGPKFVKIGSSVRYRESDVKAWEETRT